METLQETIGKINEFLKDLPKNMNVISISEYGDPSFLAKEPERKYDYNDVMSDDLWLLGKEATKQKYFLIEKNIPHQIKILKLANDTYLLAAYTPKGVDLDLENLVSRVVPRPELPSLDISSKKSYKFKS